MTTALYPPIEPYASGMLDVGDGRAIYWEACGDPRAKPALALHGGPGSGRSIAARRYFDPARYRLILFDQRGCGRSAPLASDPGTDLSANTTKHSIADIEALRIHLGVERWLVFGASWGSTLALAYAQAHPTRVTEMILRAVVTTTRAEVDWITEGVGVFLPEAWERFHAGASARAAERLVDAYARLLNDSDSSVREKAARDWCDWEIALVALHAGQPPDPRYDDAGFRFGFARLVTHYWRNAAWMGEDELLSGVERIAHIPCVMIHGRLDIGSPLNTAWRLAQRWRASQLIIASEAGHDGRDPGMLESVIAATERFAMRAG